MQLLGYSLLILVALEWSFSESFTITDNLPSGEVEAKLKNFLDAKKNNHKTPKKKENKQETQDGEKVDQKATTKRWWQRKKKPLNLCKTTFKQRQHLCTKILFNEPYQVAALQPGTMQDCSERPIAMGDGYKLPMFSCEPVRTDQPQYLMGSTGEDGTSFYLFKSELEEGHYNIRVEAFITLSEEDLDSLKRIKKAENRHKFRRLLHDLTLGVLYNSHNL